MGTVPDCHCRRISGRREKSQTPRTPAGVPVEVGVGAVFGSRNGFRFLPTKNSFATGKGFTSPEEAKRFVAETGVDWLSVAVGNVHGPPDAPFARKWKQGWTFSHLQRIYEATRVPLVLHGGSGESRRSTSWSDAPWHNKDQPLGTAIRRVYQEPSPSLKRPRKRQSTMPRYSS